MLIPPPTSEYNPAARAHIASPDVPLDLEQLERTRAALLDEIRSIEGQLGSRDRRGPDGQRLVGEEYWAWRGRARHAWQAMQREYAELGKQIADLKRHQQHAAKHAVGEPEQLLRDLHGLVRRWLAEGVTVPRPSETELLDRVEVRLGKRDPNAIRVEASATP